MATNTADKPPSRYTTTEYNRHERVNRRLRDCYERARAYHWPHSKLLAALKSEVHDHPDTRKLTAYYRGMVAGTSRMLFDNLYRYHLEWRLYLDGKLVLSKDIPDKRRGEAREGEHVWADAPEHVWSDAPAHVSSDRKAD